MIKSRRDLPVDGFADKKNIFYCNFVTKFQDVNCYLKGKVVQATR